MSSPAAAAAPPPIEDAIRAALIMDDPVDHEVEHWNALRKAKKRSFREPWRSFAIGTTTIFGFSMWLLPDSVADVVQLLTFALTVASIWAGWRKPADDPAD